MFINVLVNAVRAFYFCGDNKTYDSNGEEKKGEDSDETFTTKVLGSEFRVDGEVLNNLLEITARGGEARIPPNFDYVEACKIVCGDNGIVEFVDDVGKLDTHT